MDVFIHSRFDAEFRRHPLVLIDVGARGGVKSNWARAERYLRSFGFEPDKGEFSRLVARSKANQTATTFFETALHSRRGPIRLNIARDRGLTSVFEPDREFLDAFPEAARFDVVDTQQVDADTLDNQLQSHNVSDVDFVKVDTQGSELFVLEGARHTLDSTVLGVEVEAEFTPIYRGQPLFADVDKYLRERGFLLFSLRPCYWKRAAGRSLGGPRGQVIWADALYLKRPDGFRQIVAGLEPERRRSKILRAISICLLYGYCDYALEISRCVGEAISPEDRDVIEQQLRKTTARSIAIPGRRQLAAAFHRLWKVLASRSEGWSVSDAELGNPG
jgi:FkbM family methyltransferase